VGLAAAFLEICRDHGDKVGQVCDGRAHTYADLLRGAGAVADGLVAAGVRPGEHVGLLLANGPDFIHAFLGARLAGAVPLPFNARYKAYELRHVIVESDAVLVLMHGSTSETVRLDQLVEEAIPGILEARWPASLPHAPALRGLVSMDDSFASTLPGSRFREGGQGWTGTSEPAEQGEIGMLCYTSGTTSFPRACMLRDEGLVAVSRGMAARFGIGPGDRVWSPLPLFHTSALQIMHAALLSGATYMTDSYFDPVRAAQTFADYPPTHFLPMFGLVARRIAEVLAGVPDGRERLAQVRVMGANMPREDQRKWQGLLPPGVNPFGGYGLTEGSGAISISNLDETPEQRGAKLGVPLDCVTIRIRTEAGEEARPGEEGEIEIRGPTVSLGYYKDEEKTRETREGDWVRTGDRGKFHPDGQLEYTGRFKDMIKVGGENVAPLEIETYLLTHPAVSQACVVGIPDAEYGEAPAAFVIPKPGMAPSERELIAHCVGKLSRWKHPRRIVFVDAFPMSATKVRRGELRETMLELVKG